MFRQKFISCFSFLMFILLLVSCREQRATHIWLVGDSTMAWKKPSRAPESGWGEGLKLYVTGRATVHNHAASGRSTKSFLDEGRWQVVQDSLETGDFVIIQFGHNDEKADERLHTVAFGTFKENLKTMINETRLKGATPIVCSSIVRRQFRLDGSLKDTHGDYIVAAREIATETQTPYIDLESLSRELVTKMGPLASQEIYNYTTRKQDSTHLNVNGAKVIAGLFVAQVKSDQLPLAKYFK
ncbi:rhamnogalacturonan acetylesterase [Mangrovibacterium marinum]|uniref:Lysophospholipase L1-like esterase n=1 Tax=Mangrovibacterium marinum TaxID=1639118 RepID=A0A2T5BXR8_9BACT|nr:rhamnogalacturonan acetylesterase [Mangrovibacterium marinum]PTN05918.1 lysophospholipase L1-like esterase [Mangrovibacterium marinum]